MKKTIIWITGFVIIIGAFFALFLYVNSSKSNHDYGIVYDEKGTKIKTIKSHKSIIYLSDLMGDVGAKTSGIRKNVSKNTQLKLHYVIYQKSPRLKVDLYVYDNKTITIKNIPIVSFGNWPVNDTQYKKLITPNYFH